MGVCVLSADTGGHLRVTRFGLIAILLILSPLGIANAQAPSKEEEVNRVTALQVDPIAYQLWAVLHHPKVPKYARSVAFWEAVARCETGIRPDGSYGEWDRGKNWGPKARSYVSGGVGLAHSTWQGYGGWAYAKKAAKATKTEQIIVATRVAFIGYQTKNVFITLEDKLNNRPYYRPPAGIKKWGGVCTKNFIKTWKKTVKSKP